MSDLSEIDAADALCRWDIPGKHVAYLLKSLMHGLRNGIETALRDAGLDLSMAHLVTLSAIQCDPGLPGAQLAKRLLITAQSMNALLRGLADDGLAEWRPNPTNQRAQSWFITAAGQRILERAAQACDPTFEQMQSQLDSTERAQLVGLLQRCIAGLGG